MTIPKDKNYPTDSVQCHACGGYGCATCDDKGWFTPKSHPQGRHCYYDECGKPIPPNHTTVYCSRECLDNDV